MNFAKRLAFVLVIAAVGACGPLEERDPGDVIVLPPAGAEGCVAIGNSTRFRLTTQGATPERCLIVVAAIENVGDVPILEGSVDVSEGFVLSRISEVVMSCEDLRSGGRPREGASATNAEGTLVIDLIGESAYRADVDLTAVFDDGSRRATTFTLEDVTGC